MKAMMPVLLLTPPLTQLNTPYPATAFLAGYLKTLGWPTVQADLGIVLVERLFSRDGLGQAFARAEIKNAQWSEETRRIIALKDRYLDTIEPVMDFLAGHDPTLCYRIDSQVWLPMGRRFAAIQEADEAFGVMGTRDRASYYASLYLEELADFIREAVCPHFGFSRYAERIALSPPTLDGLLAALAEPDTLCEDLYLAELDSLMERAAPGLVSLSVPFPGNVLGALRIARHIKDRWPGTAVAMGGGYPNTELRSISDPRFFALVDYLCLDDGYRPLHQLLRHLEGELGRNDLKRTFCLEQPGDGPSENQQALGPEARVVFLDGCTLPDVPHVLTGVPEYGELLKHRYLQVIDMANPMHRLWSYGRWNKLMLAHGCYWKRCTFCDTSLDYINRYEMAPARLLVDRIEALIAQTGERGFHGTDEAAPPALLRDMALEILRRRLSISWWTNIRFDKNFSPDICRLLAASGCVAVTGGIEVAGERLLGLINKGVSLPQLAQVCRNFTEAGIMTHGYLMYGFPTETALETIDSLEMVRQLFASGVLLSGFWHRLSVTRHAPLGQKPGAFGIVLTDPSVKPFANNDMAFTEPGGIDHDRFGPGLEKALFNYMHGLGLDAPLSSWFETKVPRPSLAPDSVEQWLAQVDPPGPEARLLWLGGLPRQEAGSKGRIRLIIDRPQSQEKINLLPGEAPFILDLLDRARLESQGPLGLSTLDGLCRESTGQPALVWLQGPSGRKIREAGLLVL